MWHINQRSSSHGEKFSKYFLFFILYCFVTMLLGSNTCICKIYDMNIWLIMKNKYWMLAVIGVEDSAGPGPCFCRGAWFGTVEPTVTLGSCVPFSRCWLINAIAVSQPSQGSAVWWGPDSGYYEECAAQRASNLFTCTFPNAGQVLAPKKTWHCRPYCHTMKTLSKYREERRVMRNENVLWG